MFITSYFLHFLPSVFFHSINVRNSNCKSSSIHQKDTDTRSRDWPYQQSGGLWWVLEGQVLGLYVCTWTSGSFWDTEQRGRWRERTGRTVRLQVDSRWSRSCSDEAEWGLGGGSGGGSWPGCLGASSASWKVWLKSRRGGVTLQSLPRQWQPAAHWSKWARHILSREEQNLNLCFSQMLACNFIRN